MATSDTAMVIVLQRCRTFRRLSHAVWFLPVLIVPRPLMRPIPAAVPATTNDNTKPAGRLDSTTLSVSLELRDASWQPGGPNTRSIRVFAFAEAGRAPSVPGPHIRVRAGTTVQASLAKSLAQLKVKRHRQERHP